MQRNCCSRISKNIRRFARIKQRVVYFYFYFFSKILQKIISAMFPNLPWVVFLPGIHLLVLRWSNRGDQRQLGCCECPLFLYRTSENKTHVHHCIFYVENVCFCSSHPVWCLCVRRRYSKTVFIFTSVFWSLLVVIFVHTWFTNACWKAHFNLSCKANSLKSRNICFYYNFSIRLHMYVNSFKLYLEDASAYLAWDHTFPLLNKQQA